MSQVANQPPTQLPSSLAGSLAGDTPPQNDASPAALAALQCQRGRLLERLMPLAEQPADATSARIAQPLEQFCSELISYLAAGHYYILQHVTGAWSHRAEIARTTESAMRFAEQHQYRNEQGRHAPSWQVIRGQLNTVALLLTDRFDTEDRLLNGH